MAKTVGSALWDVQMQVCDLQKNIQMIVDRLGRYSIQHQPDNTNFIASVIMGSLTHNTEALLDNLSLIQHVVKGTVLEIVEMSE